MGTEWAGRTPAEILADAQGLVTALERLPAPPGLGSVVVHPMQWAFLRSYQLYWQLRDQGVNWRRAKRIRRREWERLKREARRVAERHKYDEAFEQVLADHPIITDYLARH